MAPDFGYTIIYVPSVPDAIAFYEGAFGFTDSFIHDSNDYGELNTGVTKLAFTSHALAAKAVPFEYQPSSPDGVRLGVEVTLITPEADALFHRAVKAGATEIAAPHDTPWGQRVAYVADINGFPIGIATPMG